MAIKNTEFLSSPRASCDISDMDEESQLLQQRLSKTRQIKQGMIMMQELLTGRTRLV